jgi:hypothetical protein
MGHKGSVRSTEDDAGTQPDANRPTRFTTYWTQPGAAPWEPSATRVHRTFTEISTLQSRPLVPPAPGRDA